jgi:hypothetical protein
MAFRDVGKIFPEIFKKGTSIRSRGPKKLKVMFLPPTAFHSGVMPLGESRMNIHSNAAEMLKRFLNCASKWLQSYFEYLSMKILNQMRSWRETRGKSQIWLNWVRVFSIHPSNRTILM